MKHPNPSTWQSIMLTLIFSLLMLCPIHAASSKVSSNTIVKVEPSTGTALLGETFTINITIVNVQNLYGLDLTLHWNASALQLLNVNLQLGVESHPGGVLHEIPPDASILVAEDNVSQALGEYHLAVTSVAPAPSFSGSGNIATLTFNVTSLGRSEFNLETQLMDYPPPDREPRISLPIEHTDIDGSVDIIPEFPSVAVLTLFIIIATIVVALSKKLLKKNLAKTLTLNSKISNCLRQNV